MAARQHEPTALPPQRPAFHRRLGNLVVGAGPTFDPNATVPLPAGSSVTHFAKGVHFDGAKDEQATILVWGEGPATSTPFAAPPNK
jgi:hypothetical protein